MYERGSPPLRAYQIGLIDDPIKERAVYDASSLLTYLRRSKKQLQKKGFYPAVLAELQAILKASVPVPSVRDGQRLATVHHDQSRKRSRGFPD
jgi:hypothetical protein